MDLLSSIKQALLKLSSAGRRDGKGRVTNIYLFFFLFAYAQILDHRLLDGERTVNMIRYFFERHNDITPFPHGSQSQPLNK